MSQDKKSGIDQISLRLRSARKLLAMKQTDFSVPVGITQASLSELEQGKRPCSLSLLLAIEHVHGISRHWLETGRGEMFAPGAGCHRPDEIPEPAVIVAPLGADRKRTGERYEFATVPILEDAAAAGAPSVVRDDQVIGHAVIHQASLQHGRHVAVFVRGDSMKPILKDGDLVAVNLDRTDPKRLLGKLVVAALDDGVTIKYLRKGRAGRFLLVPENREHTPLDVEPDELRLVGAVEWAFTKFE